MSECLPQDAAVRFKIKAQVETLHMRTTRQAGTNESRHMGSSVFNIWFTHGCTLVFNFNGDIYCGLNEIKQCYGQYTPEARHFGCRSIHGMAGVKCFSTGRGIMHSFSFLKYCLSCSQGHWGAGIHSCCLRVKAVLRPVTCHQFNRRATQRDKQSPLIPTLALWACFSLWEEGLSTWREVTQTQGA